MVFDAKDQYPSQWAAIESIAGKIGCTGETLRKWVRQGERDSNRDQCALVVVARAAPRHRQYRELLGGAARGGVLSSLKTLNETPAKSNTIEGPLCGTESRDL